MNSYTIAMLTCDRQKLGNEDLLSITMNSMKNSGLWESGISFKLILHDTGSDDLSYLDKYKSLPNVIIHTCDKKYHQIGNAVQLFDKLRKNYKSDYLIFLEDDIYFSKNWIQNLDRWLDKYKDPKYIMYSCYTPYREIRLLANRNIDVWLNYNIGAYYGAQCLIFPFNQVEHIYTDVKESIESGYKGYFDMQLKKWFNKRKVIDKIPACCPSIVQHINRSSTLKTPTHQSYFLGEDKDPQLCI